MHIEDSIITEILNYLADIANGEFKVTDEDIVKMSEHNEPKAQLLVGFSMLNESLEFNSKELAKKNDALRKSNKQLKQFAYITSMTSKLRCVQSTR